MKVIWVRSGFPLAIDFVAPAGTEVRAIAIWDAATEHPTSGMGYGKPRSFVNPDWFFEKNLCIAGTVE